MKIPFIKNLNLLLYLLVFVFLQSCDPSRFYEGNFTINKANWPASEKIGFDIDIVDSIQSYNFYINVRHNTDYDYSNLYLFVGIHYPNNDYTRDTIELVLAKPDGEWLGKGFGKLKENNILIKKQMAFPHTGVYRFEFEQAMRTRELSGIEDLGIRLEKIQE